MAMMLLWFTDDEMYNDTMTQTLSPVTDKYCMMNVANPLYRRSTPCLCNKFQSRITPHRHIHHMHVSIHMPSVFC